MSDKKPNSSVKLVEVKPLKDWVLHQNEHHFDLKKGETAKVPEHFLPALKTEKVI